MKKELIHSLTNSFESYAQKTAEGIEFWLARDLQQLLGYDKWDNFVNVLKKAKVACEISGQEINDHFADVGKMVERKLQSDVKQGLKNPHILPSP